MTRVPHVHRLLLLPAEINGHWPKSSCVSYACDRARFFLVIQDFFLLPSGLFDSQVICFIVWKLWDRRRKPLTSKNLPFRVNSFSCTDAEWSDLSCYLRLLQWGIPEPFSVMLEMEVIVSLSHCCWPKRGAICLFCVLSGLFLHLSQLIMVPDNKVYSMTRVGLFYDCVAVCKQAIRVLCVCLQQPTAEHRVSNAQ